MKNLIIEDTRSELLNKSKNAEQDKLLAELSEADAKQDALIAEGIEKEEKLFRCRYNCIYSTFDHYHYDNFSNH